MDVTPSYQAPRALGVNLLQDCTVARLIEEVPCWYLRRNHAQYLMLGGAFCAGVDEVLVRLHAHLGERRGPVPFNGCILRCYENQREELDWSPGETLGWRTRGLSPATQASPIAVVSLGATREFQWRLRSTGDEAPPEIHRQKLEHGSLLLLSPDFQRSCHYRLPKARGKKARHIWLTFSTFEARGRLDTRGHRDEGSPPLDAQRQELRRRVEEHGADPGSALPWDEVLARARAR